MKYLALLLILYIPFSYSADYSDEITEYIIEPCIKKRFKGQELDSVRQMMVPAVAQFNTALNVENISKRTRMKIYKLVKRQCIEGSFSGGVVSGSLQSEIRELIDAEVESKTNVKFMWALLLGILIGIWTYFDSRKRKNNQYFWTILNTLGGAYTLPIYLAKRNLKEGETREGGLGWNIAKFYALTFSTIMAMGALYILISTSGIAAFAGLGIYGVIWIGTLVGLLALGIFLKKTNHIETGPTGKLKH